MLLLLIPFSLWDVFQALASGWHWTTFLMHLICVYESLWITISSFVVTLDTMFSVRCISGSLSLSLSKRVTNYCTMHLICLCFFMSDLYIYVWLYWIVPVAWLMGYINLSLCTIVCVTDSLVKSCIVFSTVSNLPDCASIFIPILEVKLDKIRILSCDGDF